jgi:hypothetical protein
MGRHIIGYEVQKILALIDWFEHQNAASARPPPASAWPATAKAAARLLQRRARPAHPAALVSGYFGPRENLWDEPIYRNVFGSAPRVRRRRDRQSHRPARPHRRVLRGPRHHRTTRPQRRPNRRRPGPALHPRTVSRSRRNSIAPGPFSPAIPLSPRLIHGNEGMPVPPG